MAAILSAPKRWIHDRRTMEVFWILWYLSFWRYRLTSFHFPDEPPSNVSQRFLWLQPDCNTWQQYYQLQNVAYIIEDEGSVLNTVVPFALKILTRMVSVFRRAPSNVSQWFLWLQPDCNTWQQYYQLQSVEYMIEGRWKCSEYCSTFGYEDIDSHGFFLQMGATIGKDLAPNNHVRCMAHGIFPPRPSYIYSICALCFWNGIQWTRRCWAMWFSEFCFW